MIVQNNVLIKVDNCDIKDGRFEIPEGVTSIRDSAFQYRSKLTSVTIPDSVTIVGHSAFQYCRELTNVTIGNSVTSIGGYAFWGCSRLTSKKSNYKAFNIKNGKLYCLNKEYKENTRHFVQGELSLCENGIHYCTNLFEIFNYYYGKIDEDIAIYEIEVGNKILKATNSKCCTNSYVLKKRLYREEIIKILNGELE